MYAVVKTGGKQIKVEEGAEIVVEKLGADVGDVVDLDVLFYSNGEKVVSDPAAVSTAKVTAEIIEQFKGKKVIVFKFKKRKGYKRTKGHRQQLTRVRVTGISAPKAGAKKAVKSIEAEAAPAQCEAVKTDGERCRNKAREGSKYCGVHAKKYEG